MVSKNVGVDIDVDVDAKEAIRELNKLQTAAQKAGRAIGGAGKGGLSIGGAIAAGGGIGAGLEIVSQLMEKLFETLENTGVMETFTEAIDLVFKAIAPLAGVLLDSLGPVLVALTPSIAKLAEALAPLIQILGTSLLISIQLLIPPLDAAIFVIEKLTGFLGKLYQAYFEFLAGILDKIPFVEINQEIDTTGKAFTKTKDEIAAAGVEVAEYTKIHEANTKALEKATKEAELFSEGIDDYTEATSLSIEETIKMTEAAKEAREELTGYAKTHAENTEALKAANKEADLFSEGIDDYTLATSLAVSETIKLTDKTAELEEAERKLKEEKVAAQKAIDEVIVKVIKEAENLDEAYTNLTEETIALKKEAELLETALGEDNEAVVALSEEIKKNEEALDNLSEAGGELIIVNEELEKAEKERIKTEEELKNLNKSIEQQVAAVLRETKDLNKALIELEKKDKELRKEYDLLTIALGENSEEAKKVWEELVEVNGAMIKLKEAGAGAVTPLDNATTSTTNFGTAAATASTAVSTAVTDIQASATAAAAAAATAAAAASAAAAAATRSRNSSNSTHYNQEGETDGNLTALDWLDPDKVDEARRNGDVAMSKEVQDKIKEAQQAVDDGRAASLTDYLSQDEEKDKKDEEEEKKKGTDSVHVTVNVGNTEVATVVDTQRQSTQSRGG